MKRLAAAVALVLSTLASTVFGVEPAGAGTREFRYAIHSNVHSYDIKIVHDWTNGWFFLEAHRYTKGFGAYLGREINSHMPDWMCPIVDDLPGNSSDIIHLRPNYALGETTGDPRWQPWQPCYEGQAYPGPPSPGWGNWEVTDEAQGWSGYNAGHTVRLAGPIGGNSFGYWAPMYGSPFFRYHAMV